MESAICAVCAAGASFSWGQMESAIQDVLVHTFTVDVACPQLSLLVPPSYVHTTRRADFGKW